MFRLIFIALNFRQELSINRFSEYGFTRVYWLYQYILYVHLPLCVVVFYSHIIIVYKGMRKAAAI